MEERICCRELSTSDRGHRCTTCPIFASLTIMGLLFSLPLPTRRGAVMTTTTTMMLPKSWQKVAGPKGVKCASKLGHTQKLNGGSRWRRWRAKLRKQFYDYRIWRFTAGTGKWGRMAFYELVPSSGKRV